MAVTAVVVNGTLNTSGNSDFTSSGFGDVEAAIILAPSVAASDSTRDTAIAAVGFWGYNGGTPNTASNTYKSSHNVATTITWMPAASSAIRFASTTSNTIIVEYSFARTTDGLRATISSGSTSLQRKCTVILFKGLKNSYVGSDTLNGTTPVTETVGFKPSVVFILGRSLISGGASYVSATFGVAHHASTDSGTPSKQYSVHLASEDNAAAAQVNSSVNDDCVSRHYIGDGTSATKTYIESVTTTTFDFVCDSASGASVSYLAMEFDDPDNFYTTIYDAYTSTGTEAKSGFGFAPIAVGQANVRNSTLNNTSTSPTGAYSIGVATSVAAGAMLLADEDAADPTDTSARHDSTYFAPFYDHNDSVDALAKVTTWGSDGVTLTWDDAAAAAYKYLFWAIGADTGGGVNAGVGNLTVTGYAPTVTTQRTVSTGLGSLALTGYAPTVSATSDTSISAGLGSLVLSGYAPTVTVQHSVSVGAGALEVTGYDPAITAQQFASAGVGSLLLSGYAPTITVTSEGQVSAGVGALVLTGYAPTVTTQILVAAGLGSLSITGYEPTASVTGDTAISTGLGSLTLTGYAPTVDILLNVLPDVGQIILTGYAPTVTGGTPSVVPSQHGGGGKAKRRRRYQVEIDGQTFDVSSVEEAQELLDQAEQVAQEQAQKATEKAASAPKRQKRKVLADARKALAMPQVRVVGSDVDPVAAQIEQQAREFVDRVTGLYREALQAVEIGAILRKQALEQEEDDVITVLMMTL